MEVEFDVTISHTMGKRSYLSAQTQTWGATDAADALKRHIDHLMQAWARGGQSAEELNTVAMFCQSGHTAGKVPLDALELRQLFLSRLSSDFDVMCEREPDDEVYHVLGLLVDDVLWLTEYQIREVRERLEAERRSHNARNRRRRGKPVEPEGVHG